MIASNKLGPKPALTALALVVILLASATTEAHSHLSMIRQGHESHGSYEAGDYHGEALAAGDFNGDGFEDLAMGAPQEDAGSTSNVGVVYYNLGSSYGITHLGAFSKTSGDFGIPSQAGARFGAALAAADFDHDGIDDLVIGAPNEDVNGVIDAGRIYIYRGTPSGFDAWITFRQEDVGGFATTDDRFGYALAIDDFNLDGNPDLAIGSPSVDSGGGMVFCRHGNASGPFGSTRLLAPDLMGFLYEAGDHFGFSLAAGNVVGDTYPDLVIGAPHRDYFSESSAGACFVARGSSGGVKHSNAIQFDAGIADDQQQWADFGFSLATGRFSSGAYDWIAVGEPERWIGANERAGRVVAIHGRSDGLFSEMTQVLTQEGFGGVSEDYDEFGHSLAAGYFGDDDQFEDLFIGSPFEDFWSVDDGGVSLLFGNWGGPGSGGYSLYGQPVIGEFAESGDQLGYAAAFGAFDYSDDDNLVISAPGEDGGSGIVHIIAPWRQVQFLNCRQSVVVDCEDQLVFSQKPFDQVFIASTTKIMTVLLACERSQLPASDPRHVPLGATYTVPSWVADDIPGSQVPLVEGEVMQLENLMITCLFRSGNDAAHAIADLLHGSQGPDVSIPLFIEEMNARAIELGMAGTHFNNANGFEQEVVGPNLGDHYSTAYDMALLSRAAMENELFNEISRTMSRIMVRNLPTGPVLNNCNNFFTWILNSTNPPGAGIKGGWTPAAMTTGCFAGDGLFREAIATTFGTPQNSTYNQDALNLVNLGVGSCVSLQLNTDDWDPHYLSVWERIRAVAGESHRLSGMVQEPLSDLRFDLFHADHLNVSDTHARMGISRISEVTLGPNQIEEFGIKPFESHDVLRLVNMEASEVRLFVERVDGHGDTYDIPPHGTLEIPGYENRQPIASWKIANLAPTGAMAHLTVEESYGFVVDRTAGPPEQAVFSAVLTRGDHATNEGYDFQIDWLESGREYTVIVHDADVVVEVPDLGPVGQEGVIELAPPWPNPFRDETRLGLALTTPALLGLSIYDVAGREVRHFEPVMRAAGAWSIDWDGRMDDGAAVVPGVYFYRFFVDGRGGAGGKLVRID